MHKRVADSKKFFHVTELPGQLASVEQIRRLRSRYVWAQNYIHEKDILEVGCGSGIGLGLLEKTAKTLVAGDISKEILEIAKRHYQGRVSLLEFKAEDLPFPDASKDVLLCLEVFYFLEDPNRFLSEAKRVLRPGGKLLITTCNKDVPAFHPSEFAKKYFGVVELDKLLKKSGFKARFFGDNPPSHPEMFLRPLKKILVENGWIPKSLVGRAFLKFFLYGKLKRLPKEVFREEENYFLQEVTGSEPNKRYKIIFCEAEISKP